MPLYRKKHKSGKKYIIWAIIILLLVLMFISLPPKPEITEIVLWP